MRLGRLQRLALAVLVLSAIGVSIAFVRKQYNVSRFGGIRARDLTTCSGCGHVGTCSRCPGLAFMEGNMYGPSTADCEKSFARTGIPSANMMKRSLASASRQSLVQIHVA